MEWKTERQSGSERERGLKEREPWNKKLIFSLELCYSAILKIELHLQYLGLTYPDTVFRGSKC